MFTKVVLSVLVFLYIAPTHEHLFKYYNFGQYDVSDQKVVYEGSLRSDDSQQPIDKFQICLYARRTSEKMNFMVLAKEDKEYVNLGINEDYIFLTIDQKEIKLNTQTPLTNWIPVCFYWRSSDGKSGIYTMKNEQRDEEVLTFNLQKGFKIPSDVRLRLGYDSPRGYIGNFQMWDNLKAENECGWVTCNTLGNLVSLNKGTWKSFPLEKQPCETNECPIPTLQSPSLWFNCEDIVNVPDPKGGMGWY